MGRVLAKRGKFILKDYYVIVVLRNFGRKSAGFGRA
jgi:hypothetical protein